MSAEVVTIYGGWLDKEGIAAEFDMSVRWIEERMAEGLPHVHIGNRARFRVSEVEPWLWGHGFIERKGEPVAA